MKAVEMPVKEHFMAGHVESDYKEDKETKPTVTSKSLSTIHDHSKAAAYLAELTAKIIRDYGQDKLDELYEQVDQFQSDLSGRSVFASGVQEQFGLCAAAERKAENKD